jgi:O-methyltransferase
MKMMRILERARLFAPSLVYRILQMTNHTIMSDKRFLDVYWQLVRDGRMILSIREAYNLYFHLQQTLALGGAVAELGVYQGGGAKLISEFKSDLPLHLFDTFGGMPEVDHAVDLYRKGDFSDTTIDSVKRYLKDYSNVHFHKGFFPDTAGSLPDGIEFCFVHLDVDLYESTLSGLNFFYPRLKKGGILISHDYNSRFCPGVKKAFDEFSADRNQEVIFLWDTQCMVKKS